MGRDSISAPPAPPVKTQTSPLANMFNQNNISASNPAINGKNFTDRPSGKTQLFVTRIPTYMYCVNLRFNLYLLVKGTCSLCLHVCLKVCKDNVYLRRNGFLVFYLMNRLSRGMATQYCHAVTFPGIRVCRPSREFTTKPTEKIKKHLHFCLHKMYLCWRTHTRTCQPLYIKHKHTQLNTQHPVLLAHSHTISLTLLRFPTHLLQTHTAPARRPACPGPSLWPRASTAWWPGPACAPSSPTRPAATPRCSASKRGSSSRC